MNRDLRLVLGDCRRELAGIDGGSVDAIVTDPPYELGFMGRKWDASGVAYNVDVWRHCLRVLKPGGRLLAFGGTRTYHRMACAIEDAGFYIEDSLCWLYGSGFPKHKSKLKPAHEPIVMALKPDRKATPLRIDECRIGTEDRAVKLNEGKQRDNGWGRMVGTTVPGTTTLGRWPANVVLDEEAAALLDAMSGERKSHDTTGIWNGSVKRKRQGNAYGVFTTKTAAERRPGRADSGGASRFFYCSKASRRERNAGLEGMPERKSAKYNNGDGFAGRTMGPDGVWINTDHDVRKTAANSHPTVKPIAVMAWLIRLVAAPGSLVLDPFMGSGSTGLAAVAEGCSFIGIDDDSEPGSFEIASRRIAAARAATPLFA